MTPLLRCKLTDSVDPQNTIEWRANELIKGENCLALELADDGWIEASFAGKCIRIPPHRVRWVEAEGVYVKYAVNDLGTPIALLSPDAKPPTGAELVALAKAAMPTPGHNGTIPVDDDEPSVGDLTVGPAVTIPLDLPPGKGFGIITAIDHNSGTLTVEPDLDAMTYGPPAPPEPQPAPEPEPTEPAKLSRRERRRMGKR